MPKTTKLENVEQAVEVIAEKDTEIEDLKAKLNEKDSEGVKVELSEALEAKSLAEDKSNRFEAALTEKDAEIENLKSEKKTVQDELEAIKLDLRNQERFSKLSEIGLVLSEEDKTKYSNYKDETFQALLEVFEKYPVKKVVEAGTTNVTVDEADELETEEEETDEVEDKEDEDDVAASLVSTLRSRLNKNK